MTNKRIPDLTAATTPLAGTELVPVWDGTTTKQVSVTNLTAGREVAGTQFTASAGNFVNSASGKGLAGTGAADNADAGVVGEYVVSTNTTLTAMTAAVGQDVTSISLTPGDWDVSGTMGFTPSATTTITNLKGSITATSATYNDNPTTSISDYYAAIVSGISTTFYKPMPKVRVSIASTTTIYLVGLAVFGISNLYVTGSIRARRVR